MAKGAHELRNMLQQDINAFADHEDIQKRLDDFYMSRIGIRMVRFLLSSLFFFSYFDICSLSDNILLYEHQLLIKIWLV